MTLGIRKARHDVGLDRDRRAKYYLCPGKETFSIKEALSLDLSGLALGFAGHEV